MIISVSVNCWVDQRDDGMEWKGGMHILRRWTEEMATPVHCKTWLSKNQLEFGDRLRFTIWPISYTALKPLNLFNQNNINLTKIFGWF